MSKPEEKFNKRRLRASYVTSVVSIALVLFMLGLLGLIVFHARKLSDYVKENIGFSIIMKENVPESNILIYQKALRATSFVKSTEYITRERAAAELQKDLGEDFVDFLGYNPLLPSIEVSLKADYANNDSLKLIEQYVLGNSQVKEVYYQKSLVDMVNQNVRKISMVLFGFSMLLMLISVALINNTIRLSVYSKRFLIKSMLLVGATQGFIQRPFLVKGLLHGLAASFLAIALLIGVLYFAGRQMPELAGLQDINIFLALFGLIVIAGLTLSSISTWLAVRKFLRMKTDHFYY
ncbi:MAG TPA: permease-like cell division protein FtsX [Bacteroidales bacterium]|jgi:cell division transport system permease protein